MLNITMNNEMATKIENERLAKKLNKRFVNKQLKKYVAKLVSDGLDETIAKIMAKADYECGTLNIYSLKRA